MSTVLGLKLRRDLRRSRAQFLAIVATIFLGVALFGGTYDAYRSLEASYQQVFDDVGFADHWVTGGDTAAIVSGAAALPGVATIESRHQADLPMRPVPDHSLFGRVVGVPDGAEIDQLLVLRGRMLDPAVPTETVVEQHTADHFGIVPGDTIEIAGGAGWTTFGVVGVVASAEYLWPSPSRQEIIASLDDFGVVFVTDTEVPTLAGGATTEQVHVRYAPGADSASLDESIDALAVSAGALDSYSRADQPSNSALQTDVSGFGELSFMFPALFLTAAGIGTWVMLTRLVMTQMSVIGTLMANGMQRGRIFRHYLAYGIVVGLAGAIPGVIAGALLAWLIAGLYTAAISVPITVLRIDLTTPITGIAFGLVAGIAAAVPPALLAIRRSPAEAMRGAFTTGIAKPTLAERVFPPLRRLPAAAAMVMRGISRNVRRTATTMLGVTLSLTLILVSWGMIDTVDGLLVRQFDRIEGSDARLVLAVYPDRSTLATISAVEGVASVEPTLTVNVSLEANGSTYATDLEAFVPGTTMHHFLTASGEVPLPADGVLLGDATRDLLGIGVGDTVTIRSAALTEPVATTVAGFVDEPLGTHAYVSIASIVSHAPSAGAEGDTTAIVPGAAVRFDPEADSTVMRGRLQATDGVLAVVGTRAFEETLKSFLGLFYAFVGIMLVFGGLLAFAIIFNTMSVNLAERTVEVATLKASGMTDRRLSRLISAENLIVTVIGLVPGLVIGYLAAAEFMAAYSNDQFSFDLMMKPTTLAFSALAIVFVTLLSQIPGLRAIRRLDVAKVVRERAV